jgi:hypothetical protein
MNNEQTKIMKDRNVKQVSLRGGAWQEGEGKWRGFERE